MQITHKHTHAHTLSCPEELQATLETLPRLPVAVSV